MHIKINSCGLHDCSADWNWHTPKTGISDYDLWAVFRGKGTFTCGEKRFALREGFVLLLPPGVFFCADHDPSRPLFIINIHFDFLNQKGEPRHPFPLLARVMEDPSFFRTLMTRIITNFNRNQMDAARHFMQALLTEFQACRNPENSDITDEWLHIIREIAGEIDLITPISTLEDYARRFGYSRRYIGKKFFTVMGISFSDYIRNARISKAKTLLRQTDTPMSQIAEAVGFCDACHFAKTFRATEGISPLAYRKNA